MSTPPNLDQITNDLRARLASVANDIEQFAQGHGAWRAPDQVYLGLSICEGMINTIRSEMRRHGLVKGARP